ncbi:MAG TPA: hypothetical protein VMS11_04175 [Solirubrobacterales bacterium]|nr:hypothetical protein [Solirubrobacterales bacterium]
MIGRRAVVGVCMLCALLVSAFAAQSASAVTKGTTAFTCAKVAQPGVKTTKGFSDEHCTKPTENNEKELEKVKFEHVEIAQDVTTHAKLTNEKTANETTEAEPGLLKATVATIPIELKATGVASTSGGWLENKKVEVEKEKFEHYSFGEGQINFTGVTVVTPKNCKVVSALGEGVVETTQLVATTKGQGDFLKFEPKAGPATAFAEFEIVKGPGAEECAAAQKVKIVGSVKGVPNGATTTFTHEEVTTQGTLRFGSAAGPKAGLTGKATITAGKGKDNVEKPEPTNPIAATTVETP